MADGGAVGGFASGAVGVSATASIKAKWGLPVEELRKLQQWGELFHGIQDSLKNTTFRRLLSHHTSRTCQPQKQAGGASWEIIGWENPIEVDEGKSIQVRIVFPHAHFFVDNHDWQITSGKLDTLGKAQCDVATTALMWLLANHPAGVVFPEKCFCETSVRLSEE